MFELPSGDHLTEVDAGPAFIAESGFRPGYVGLGLELGLDHLGLGRQKEGHAVGVNENVDRTGEWVRGVWAAWDELGSGGGEEET